MRICATCHVLLSLGSFSFRRLETMASWMRTLTTIWDRSGICIIFWPSRTGSP